MSDPTATWLDTYEPLRGLLADLLDFTTNSHKSTALSQSYCFLAVLTQGPRPDGLDEGVVGAAGEALLVVTSALRRALKDSLAHSNDAEWMRGNQAYLAQAASIIPRLVDLMGAASGEVQP